MRRAIKLSFLLIALVAFVNVYDQQTILWAEEPPTVSVNKSFIQEQGIFVIFVSDNARKGIDDSNAHLPFNDEISNQVRVDLTNLTSGKQTSMVASELGTNSNHYILAISLNSDDQATIKEGAEQFPAVDGDSILVTYPSIISPLGITSILVDNSPPKIRIVSPPSGSWVGQGDVEISAIITDQGSGFSTSEEEISRQSATHGIIKFTVLNTNIQKSLMEFNSTNEGWIASYRPNLAGISPNTTVEITVDAVDRAGNTNSLSWNITVGTPVRPDSYVVGIVDGNTLKIMLGGTEEEVRLIGVDTPEAYGKTECFGLASSNVTGNLAPQDTILRLEKDVSDRDSFGRLLRYVYLPDDRMLNEVLIEKGYGIAKSYPPDVKFHNLFLTSQEIAKSNHIGIWNPCNNEISVDSLPRQTAAASPTPTLTPTSTPNLLIHDNLKSSLDIPVGQKSTDTADPIIREKVNLPTEVDAELTPLMKSDNHSGCQRNETTSTDPMLGFLLLGLVFRNNLKGIKFTSLRRIKWKSLGLQ